jgi:hypothetical protein
MSEAQNQLFKPGDDSINDIAKMPAYHFWTRLAAIGTTQEESDAAARNELSPERILEIRTNAQRAYRELCEMDVPGFKEWMGRMPNRWKN